MSEIVLETRRLVLRAWRIEDAKSLFRYAKEPLIGERAGWQAHQSEEESREIIRTVFACPETYAMVLKETREPIGCVGLLLQQGHLPMNQNEAEIGYWLAKPYWNKGLTTEAAKRLICHAFCDLSLERLWACVFEGNAQSLALLKKCGFVLHHCADKEQTQSGKAEVYLHLEAASFQDK